MTGDTSTRLLPDGTTTCCGAVTSIDEHGAEYCKACFEAVAEYLTTEPPTRYRVDLETGKVRPV